MIYPKFTKKKWKRILNKKRLSRRIDKFGVYHKSAKLANLANKYLD